jgi:hypothetical protein
MGETAVSSHPDDADSLVLPDGTPVRIKVLDGFSSTDAKVGDVLHFAVAFEVRADGVVVIPQRTEVAAKVVFVSRPRRGARDAQVKIAYEAITLPTGETATVRPILKPPHKGAKVAEEAAKAPGEAAALFITAGLPLLALFSKGDEQGIPKGTIEVVYLNGPLRISRKAAIALQPALASGYAYVYVNGGIFVQRRHRSRPKLFCGERLISPTYAGLLLELPPGTYWFSTEDPKDRPARIDVLPSHEYHVGRNRQGLIAKELQAKKNRFSPYPNRVADEDLTKLTPEEYRSLTVEPAVKGNH